MRTVDALDRRNAVMMFTLLLLLAVGIPTVFVVNAWLARVRGHREHGYPHATDGGEPTIYRRPTETSD